MAINYEFRIRDIGKRYCKKKTLIISTQYTKLLTAQIFTSLLKVKVHTWTDLECPKRERHGTYGTGGVEGLRICLNECERHRPLNVFDPRPVQPVGSTPTAWAIHSYSPHNFTMNNTWIWRDYTSLWRGSTYFRCAEVNKEKLNLSWLRSVVFLSREYAQVCYSCVWRIKKTKESLIP